MNRAGAHEAGQGGRLAWVDAAKGVGIILVVFRHVVPENMVPGARSVRDAIYLFHMPLFFLLSGYTFRPAPLARLAGSRALGLLVPYAAFYVGLMAVILGLQAAAGGPSGPDVWLDALLDALLGGERLEGAVGVFWFINCLFVTILVYAALVSALGGPRSPRLAAVLLAILVGGYAFEAAWPELYLPWALSQVPHALFAFWLGALIRETDFDFRVLGVAVLTVAAAFGVGAWLGAKTSYNMINGDFGLPLLGTGLACGLSVLLIAALRSLPLPGPALRALVYLGQASLAIMFVHQFVRFSANRAGLPDFVVFWAALLLPLVVYEVARRYTWPGRVLLGKGWGSRASTREPEAPSPERWTARRWTSGFPFAGRRRGEEP